MNIHSNIKKRKDAILKTIAIVSKIMLKETTCKLLIKGKRLSRSTGKIKPYCTELSINRDNLLYQYIYICIVSSSLLRPQTPFSNGCKTTSNMWIKECL